MVAPVVAASLVGGGLSLLGGLFGNSARRKEAAKDRAFQLEMAKNAHQYEVEDLRKAGLNPILSGTGGPGARASGGSRADQSDPLTPAINSALSAQRMQQELDNLKAVEQNTKMDTALKSTQINSVQAEAPLKQSQEKLNLANIPKIEQEVSNLGTAQENIAQDTLLKANQAKQAGNNARVLAVEAEIQEWMLKNGLSEAAKAIGLGADATALLKMILMMMRK